MADGSFLTKALESLASAEDDYAARRYNACARNSYYAAFQAAIAALLAEGIRPSRRWEHEFVHARFAGVLVKRRKLYSPSFAGLLPRAFQLRAEADYTETPVGGRPTQRILDGVKSLVKVVEGNLSGDS